MIFTLVVGDQTVQLPEAETRDQALLRAGLTPCHWQETPAKQRQAGKGKAQPVKSTTDNPTGEKGVSKQASERRAGPAIKGSVTPTVTKLCVCGQPLQGKHQTCSNKCRQRKYRKSW
jgi:hypothetical protein